MIYNVIYCVRPSSSTSPSTGCVVCYSQDAADTTVAKLKKQSGVDWAIVCYAGGISRDVITR